MHLERKIHGPVMLAALEAGEVAVCNIPKDERPFGCTYRSDYGPCIVGVVLPDEIAKNNNTTAIGILFGEGQVTSDDNGFFNQAQFMHDQAVFNAVRRSAFIAELKEFLRELA